MVIDKPQKVEIQKIDSMVVLIWPGDLMLRKDMQYYIHSSVCLFRKSVSMYFQTLGIVPFSFRDKFAKS